MKRLHEAALFGLAIVLPAAVQGFRIFLANPPRCIAAVDATYRVSATACTPDYQVKIDNHAVHPSLAHATCR